MSPPTVVIERYQETHQPTVVSLRFHEISYPWEQWFLLRGDAHHDNTHCLHRLERRHLEQAKERNALILDFGDLHCAMQGKYDPRRSFSQCPPELRVDNYLPALTAYNFDFYRPYAKLFALLVPGNHETAILSKCQYDLTGALAERLVAEGSPVQVGTYRGWVRLLFNAGNLRASMNLHYTHGYGGGGPVTKDIIQASRQLEYIQNADIVVFAHTHYQWHVGIPREGLSGVGRPELHTVDVVKPGTYKDEFSPASGWATERGMGPKPLGAYWMRVYYKRNRFYREFIRAEAE